MKGQELVVTETVTEAQVVAGQQPLVVTETKVAGHAVDGSCPAVFPGVSAWCTAGTSCCGGNTRTPECYFEEFNSCCQPEGSLISILCAKGQSCSSIDGLPTCVPIGNEDACNCAKMLGKDGTAGDYFCKSSTSSMCYHAPDRQSC